MIARITLGEKANMEWNDFVKFREGIKSAFESYGKIKFVDFKQGEKSGFEIRRRKVAAKIIESIQGNAIEATRARSRLLGATRRSRTGSHRQTRERSRSTRP